MNIPPKVCGSPTSEKLRQAEGVRNIRYIQLQMTSSPCPILLLLRVLPSSHFCSPNSFLCILFFRCCAANNLEAGTEGCIETRGKPLPEQVKSPGISGTLSPAQLLFVT